MGKAAKRVLNSSLGVAETKKAGPKGVGLLCLVAGAGFEPGSPMLSI
jgi:hypothetical protein